MADKNLQKYDKAISALEMGVEGMKLSMDETKLKLASMDTAILEIAESTKSLRQDFRALMDVLKKDGKSPKMQEGSSSVPRPRVNTVTGLEMDETKLYLCFEATNTEGESVYLIFSTKVSDLMGRAQYFRPKFTLESSISGVSAMGCGLFNSKIVLAGGFSGAGENKVYNQGLVTYDTVTKKVVPEDIPDMRARKVRPLVFELYGRLYVLDTSNSFYKRAWEVYYPTKKYWDKVSDPFCTIFNQHLATKNINISGRTPYSWFVCGKELFIALPRVGPTYFHYARDVSKCFTYEDSEPLPFDGRATTYWKPGFSDVVVLSFFKGPVGGNGRVEGRRLKYGPVRLLKPRLIFRTDAYEKPDGEVSSYFADCGNGKFCLTTFDNVNIHVYVFKILRDEDVALAPSLVLKDLNKHKYNFSDFSSGGFTSVSLSGCFVLPSDDETKRSEESKLYNKYFLCYGPEEEDDDLPPFIETDGGLKIHPEYDSGGGDSDFEGH